MLRQVQVLIAALSLAFALGCKKEEVPSPEVKAQKSPAPDPVALPSTDPVPTKSTPEFEVTMSGPSSATTGAESQATVQLVAGEGFKINAEYPISFQPQGSSEGIAFAQPRLMLTEMAERKMCPASKEDACELTVPVPFKATAAGEQRVAGVLAFSVCNPEKCLIEKAHLAASVPVR